MTLRFYQLTSSKEKVITSLILSYICELIYKYIYVCAGGFKTKSEAQEILVEVSFLQFCYTLIMYSLYSVLSLVCIFSLVQVGLFLTTPRNHILLVQLQPFPHNIYLMHFNYLVNNVVTWQNQKCCTGNLLKQLFKNTVTAAFSDAITFCIYRSG